MGGDGNGREWELGGDGNGREWEGTGMGGDGNGREWEWEGMGMPIWEIGNGNSVWLA